MSTSVKWNLKCQKCQTPMTLNHTCTFCSDKDKRIVQLEAERDELRRKLERYRKHNADNLVCATVEVGDYAAKLSAANAEVGRLKQAVHNLALLCRRKMDNVERGKHAVRIAQESGVLFSPLRDKQALTPATAASDVTKNSAAVELGRKGGIKGGPARAEALTPERRSEIAKQAADARWNKSKESPDGEE